MYTTTHIKQILSPLIVQSIGDSKYWVEYITIDSRQIIQPTQSLFIALQGQRTNGHNFIAQAYDIGVRVFLVDTTIHSPGADAVIITVRDCLNALHLLVEHHRNAFAYPIIGITGSNGKTIVKEWLAELLGPIHHIVRSPKSYNSQIGVPLSVWRMNDQHTLGLFEAGLSTTGEMEKLQRLIQPTIGVFTVLGSAHDEGFPSRSIKAAEKFLLFQHCKWIVHSADDDEIVQLSDHLPAKSFTWSQTGKKANVQVIKVQPQNVSTRVVLNFREKDYTVTVPFMDQASLENFFSCWCTLAVLDCIHSVPVERFAHLNQLPLRLELRHGIYQSKIINDSYNNDLTGLEVALQFLVQQSRIENRTLILSDMEQSGLAPKALQKAIVDALNAYPIRRFIGVGPQMAMVAKALPHNMITENYANTNALLADLQESSFYKAFILIKGARSFGFEEVSERLSLQVHQTHLQVNLSALSHNLSVFHKKLDPSTKIMVMVKAAAYGAGSESIARWLETQGVDYLSVAYADEGVALRQAGITLPILVLNPEEASFGTLVRYNLEPEVYSFVQGEALHRFLDFSGCNMKIHLNLDTGMHRLGFGPADWPQLCQQIKAWKNFHIASVFTHLAASEDANHDRFTTDQVTTFKAAFTTICTILGRKPMAHVLNSSGITRFPQYQMDMVRLGIGIYGCGGPENELKTVLSFRATVSQIKYIPAGESIGYGRYGRSDLVRKIATISVGYADGLPRATGNQKFSVCIREKRFPIVGQVCMDMCMVDITNADDIQVGDSVTIFGENPRVEEMAQILHTIPYEIFTGISPRVQRIYIQE